VFPLDLLMDTCGANGSASHVHHRAGGEKACE